MSREAAAGEGGLPAVTDVPEKAEDVTFTLKEKRVGNEATDGNAAAQLMTASDSRSGPPRTLKGGAVDAKGQNEYSLV